MDKHTPGPWRMGRFPECIMAGSRQVAEVRESDGGKASSDELFLADGEAVANAALIAAAPDMLDALKACAAFVEMHTGNGVQVQPPRRFMESGEDSRGYALGYVSAEVFAAAARAAIDKAEGR